MNMSYYERNKDRWKDYKAKNKEWRTENKEHLAEYQRAYRALPGKRQEHAAWRRKYDLRNLNRRLLNAARRAAKVKHLQFNLELSDISIPSLCPVLGIELRSVGGARTANSPSLDRIVPSKGYVKGNVIVVSWRANRIKADASTEELRRVADFYSAIATKD